MVQCNITILSHSLSKVLRLFYKIRMPIKLHFLFETSEAYISVDPAIPFLRMPTQETLTQGSMCKNTFWSSRHGSVETNLISIHDDEDSTPGLPQWVKDLTLP